MNVKTNAVVVVVLLFISLLTGFLSFSAFDSDKSTPLLPNHLLPEITESPKRFGLALDSFDIVNETIHRNEFLSDLLGKYQVDPVTINTLVEKSKPVFDVRKIAAGKPYTILTAKNNPAKAVYFVYQPNPIDYIVYDLRKPLKVYAGQNEVITQTETVTDTISYSLYQSLQNKGSDPDLAVYLADIYGGVIDFYAIDQGDWFKIQYERQYVGDQPVGAGKIQSAVFSHHGKEFGAFYFQHADSMKGEYYDESGKSMRRAFLKAPLKFTRISSRYSKRRLHPVQKVWRAHLGTDYAAPTGTPIVATGNGVVTHSSYTRGNGNYVKIKHDKVYTTQYLHMSRRAVKAGQRVRQGQVIGYVGSTGLATGPHVCYRFWKNGRQVDALKQNFQSAEPIPEKYRTAFENTVRRQKQELARISMQEQVNYTAYMQGPPALFSYFGAFNSPDQEASQL